MRSTLLLAALAACASDPVPLGDAAIPDASALDASVADAAAPDAAGAPDAAAPACASPEPAGALEIRTSVGTLRGVERGDTIAWLGVPYAEPPTGARRFAPPEPRGCALETRTATAFGPMCPQLDRQRGAVGDEDCLSLNVWTPKARQPRGAPVLFFIHGGGNNQGASSVMAGARFVYDGEALAARGSVVVTINYRLGALGFAAHAALDGAEPSGNQGLRDQLLALAWVRENAAAIGADPARITLFGESAGGVNVCALYTSPLARGLFAGAIVQSGGCTATTRAAASASVERLLANLSCGALGPAECLRARSPAELLAALPVEVNGLTANEFGPIVDGAVLTKTPMEALASGEHADVPFILGTNEDETAQFVPPPAQVATEAAFVASARAFLAASGVSAAKIDPWIAIYPVADYGGDPHAALVALTTDLRWSCAGRRVLQAHQSRATAPAFRYYFTHGLDAARAPVLARFGAYHGLELFYVFGSIDGAGGYAPSAADLALSARMQRYWTRFAEGGDPSGGADPPWPRHDASDRFLRLDEPSSEGAGVRTAVCDALEALLR